MLGVVFSTGDGTGEGIGVGVLLGMPSLGFLPVEE